MKKDAPYLPLLLLGDNNGIKNQQDIGKNNLNQGTNDREHPTITVENKQHGLARAEELLTIPAEIKFLSVEPLLECLGLYRYDCFQWVIVGGESGPHARPMDAEWVRYIKEQCDADRVPFFFKQHGGNKADKGGCLLDGLEYKDWPRDAV